MYPKDKDVYIKQSTTDIVVFIHGIFASHTQFNSLMDQFKELNYSIYAIALKGHGQNVKAFNHVSYKDWQNQVEEVIEKLTPTYDNIYIIAHSMGCLLTVNIEYDYKVKRVVLMAPAFKVKTSFRQIAIGIAVGKENPKLDYMKKYKKITGVYFDNLFQKILTLKPTVELLRLIHQSKKRLPDFRKDTLIIVSKNDESVRLSSGQYTYGKISSHIKELIILDKSRHTILDTEEEKKVHQRIIKFIHKGEKSNNENRRIQS